MQVRTKGIFFHTGSQIKLFRKIVRFADENLKQTNFCSDWNGLFLYFKRGGVAPHEYLVEATYMERTSQSLRRTGYQFSGDADWDQEKVHGSLYFDQNRWDCLNLCQCYTNISFNWRPKLTLSIVFLFAIVEKLAWLTFFSFAYFPPNWRYVRSRVLKSQAYQ